MNFDESESKMTWESALMAINIFNFSTVGAACENLLLSDIIAFFSVQYC